MLFSNHKGSLLRRQPRAWQHDSHTLLLFWLKSRGGFLDQNVPSVFTWLLYIPERWTCFGAMLLIEQRLLRSALTIMTRHNPTMYPSVSKVVW